MGADTLNVEGQINTRLVYLIRQWMSYMFDDLRERHYQQGCCDRKAGRLPQAKDSAYLEGYLKGRPEGLDNILQYFRSVKDYLDWKSRA